MKVYAVINQKGGVGKSTTAQAIGAGLLRKGYRVLFVDLDSQENLSYTLKAEQPSYTALEILQKPELIKAAIQETEQGDLLPSSPGLAVADTMLQKAEGREYRLSRALDIVRRSYDFCIVDTPPALGILTINALTAANEAIIPALADVYSMQGIARLYETIKLVKDNSNSRLKVAGIVLTHFKGRSIVKRQVAEAIEAQAKKQGTKVFTSRIRECQALIEAQLRRQDIYSYAPKSNAAIDYSALVDEMLK